MDYAAEQLETLSLIKKYAFNSCVFQAEVFSLTLSLDLL